MELTFDEYCAHKVVNVHKHVDPWFWDRYSAAPYVGCRNGIANKVMYIIRCRASNRSRDLDRNEVSQARWFSKGELEQMIEDKTMSDGPSLIALLLYYRSK
jgi:isopentenyldiphosphate isomerase